MNKKGVLLTITLSFVMFTSLTAQIGELNIPNQNIESSKIITYDSLESINENNVKYHIGQDIIIRDDKYSESKGNYVFLNFFTSIPHSNSYSKEKRKYIPSELHNHIEGNMYEQLKHRQFKIIDIIYGESVLYDGIDYLKLIEVENQDTVYLEVGIMVYETLLSLGYVEKLKQLYLNEEFLYIGNYENNGLYDLNTGNEVYDIPKYTKFHCKDILLADAKYDNIVLLIDNNEYGNFFTELKHIERIGTFYSLTKAENLIKQYGKTNAYSIMNKDIKLGFTKQMVIEAYGQPYDINTTVGSYGTHEQWVYKYDIYLYFENGKLTDIQR
ncbi:MAG: hypothetical protein WBI07_07375 [Mobilitalea sp.]